MAGADVRAKFCSDNCRKRYWEQDEAQRGYCKCGALLGHDAKRLGYLRCADCYDDERLAATAERGEQIEKWWAEGLTWREIGDRFGWSKARTNDEIHRLRDKGFNLPYRRIDGRTHEHLRKAA